MRGSDGGGEVQADKALEKLAREAQVWQAKRTVTSSVSRNGVQIVRIAGRRRHKRKDGLGEKNVHPGRDRRLAVKPEISAALTKR